MSREAGRSLMIAFAVILGSGFVLGTSASFIGSTKNPGNTFSSASLTPPQTLTAAASGLDMSLSWVAGSFGGGTGFGHRVMQRNMGVQADPRTGSAPPAGTCAASDTFTIAAGRTSAATTTLTHTNGGATSVAGSYGCYRVDTEYPASPSTAQWFSQTSNPVAVVMLGHVVKSVQVLDGGTTPGQLFDGDRININFNQPVNIATGPTSNNNPTGTPTTGNDVCAVSSDGMLVIGRQVFNTNCTTSQVGIVGKITGLSLSGETPNYVATYTWSDCPVAGSCRTLSVLVGRRYKGKKDLTASVTATASFEPIANASYLQSTTGAATLCNAANTATTTCRPVPTGSF